MKYLKGKTWIDWVKVIVAIDIAAVGIGLIFQQQIHILAGIFGSVSKIVFGVLYVFVAASIFKMIFPDLFEDLRHKVTEIETELDQDKQDANMHGRKIAEGSGEPKETVGEIIDKAAKKIDTFVQGRAEEVKEEVKKVLDEK